MTIPKALERKPLPGALVGVLILLGLSVFINYIDRGNLSIAAPLLKDELRVGPAQLGFLLSAFFWTYACLQPVYGWLVDRLNVYWLLAACYFTWSLATAATGLVRGFAVLFLLRLIVGFGEAVCYPAYSKIIALNYPEEHRGLANSVVAAGQCLGPGFGMLLGGTLMASFGWRPFFVALGLVSMLWLPAWIKWMPKSNLVPAADATSAPSLGEFLRLRSAWGTFVGLWCGNYVNYFLLTWLPYYLVHERHFSMSTMAKIGGAGYLISAASATLSGWLSDRWIMAGGTPTRVRKTFAGAIGISGIFLGLSAIAAPWIVCAATVRGTGILRGVELKCFRDFAETRRTTSRRPVDWLPEWVWEYRRGRRAGSHGVRSRPHREFCLGVRAGDDGRARGHCLLAVYRRHR